MSRKTPPKYVVFILERLEARGFAAFLVGGCVRDFVMGRHPSDWDVCTDALPEEVMSVFPHSRPTGIKHGTVTVMVHGSAVEVTTFRSDGVYLDHRRPESVRYLGDIRGDLERRDFTINALAMPLSCEIFDPFGGREDIGRRLIRCVGDPDRRFCEDALRMFRALRFSAVLSFEIEPATLFSIRKNAALSASLAPERIYAELNKMLLSASPERISDVFALGLMGGILGDAAPVPRLEALKELPRKRGQRWAAFCALLLRDGTIADPGEFLRTLRAEKETVRLCSAACALVRPKAPADALGWKKLLSRNGTETAVCAAAAAEALYGGGSLMLLRSVLLSGECFSLAEMALSGEELLVLGFRGPEIGKALYALLDHVLERPSENDRELLLALARDIRH